MDVQLPDPELALCILPPLPAKTTSLNIAVNTTLSDAKETCGQILVLYLVVPNTF